MNKHARSFSQGEEPGPSQPVWCSAGFPNLASDLNSNLKFEPPLAPASTRAESAASTGSKKGEQKLQWTQNVALASPSNLLSGFCPLCVRSHFDFTDT